MPKRSKSRRYNARKAHKIGGVRIVGRRELPAPKDSWQASAIPTCRRCSAQMVKRRSQAGPFWGCSRYPHCQGTSPMT